MSSFLITTSLIIAYFFPWKIAWELITVKIKKVTNPKRKIFLLSEEKLLKHFKQGLSKNNIKSEIELSEYLEIILSSQFILSNKNKIIIYQKPLGLGHPLLMDPLRIRKDFYSINVETGTWTTIGMLLDIFLTFGISSTILASMGKTGQFLFKLNKESGEICNYYEAVKKSKVEFNINELTDVYKNKKCPYKEFKCKFCKKESCTIDKENLSSNLNSLEKKGILKYIGDGDWRYRKEMFIEEIEKKNADNNA